MELKNTFESVLRASRTLNHVDDKTINSVLNTVADKAVEMTGAILEANKKDLARMDKANPMYDRLLLTPERIAGIAADIHNVAALPSPLGRILSKTTNPNGMQITKVSVPFGVIGIIYEARPNVTFDVFSLCLKSGNACLLKGGSDAEDSNRAIASIIRGVLRDFKLSEDLCCLLPAQREATSALLNAVGYVDLIIPRGSSNLINFVRDNSKIPVIETGAGICHTYVNAHADKDKARDIIFNAKTRRISVCNALDCAVIDHSRLSELAYICAPLKDKNVVIEADEEAYAALSGNYPADLLKKADSHSFGTEFLDYRMAVKTVADIHEAIGHITDFSSRHSETIISEDKDALSLFEKSIDAACVYSNVSTAFTDGAQFGLGAEIGISTQKLHARGPMALQELTSYKYLIRGNGQIRS